MCKINHAALKSDPVAWGRLALVGHQHTEADEYGPAETLELRDCSCGSTLAIRLATPSPGSK